MSFKSVASDLISIKKLTIAINASTCTNVRFVLFDSSCASSINAYKVLAVSSVLSAKNSNIL